MKDRIKEEFIQQYQHWCAVWNSMGYAKVNVVLHLLIVIREYELQLQE